MTARRGKKAVAADATQARVQSKSRTRGQPRLQFQPRQQRLLHGLYWLLATAVFGADQLSKIVAQGRLSEGPVEIFPFLNFSLAYNRGAAFGVFSGGQTATLLLAVSIAAALAFAILLHRENRVLPCLGWSLMLGGALGNGLDRLLFNRVTDFIDFHLSGHHFPAFNIADASLTFGVLLMILVWYWPSDRKEAVEAPSSSSSRPEKKTLAEAVAAVSGPGPQAVIEKKPGAQNQASAAKGRKGAPVRSDTDSARTAVEPSTPSAESTPPETGAAGAQSATGAAEAGKNPGAAASKTAPAPFAPLAEANLSRVFTAEPYSAGSRQQSDTQAREANT